MPKIALERRITVFMTLLTVAALGIISLRLLPTELIMKLEFPVVSVWIPYPGATPQQVEQEIAIPAEGEFRTVARLKEIYTRSDGGGCYVLLRFDWDTDMARACSDVRDRIERLRIRLPDDVNKIYLRRSNSETWPVLSLALLTESDDPELAHWVRTLLQPRLMRVPGVAEVSVSGAGDEQIDIAFDQNSLRSFNMGLYDVISDLRQVNVDVGVGELTEGETKYQLRAVDEVTKPSELREVPVGPKKRRLKQVASVGYRSTDSISSQRIDGKRGVFISIRKEGEANTVATCSAVKAEIERTMREPVFKGVEPFIFSDHSEKILHAVGALREAGRNGGGLALLVLVLFLRRIRATAIVALAIPTSLMPALIYMYFSDMTLNLVTMTSMIICVGMLVDNSIVVMENIHRYNQMGLPAVECARRGANEVGLAITVATLTTVVVFIPVFYMENGEMAIHMREFAAPVTVALLASLGVALTIIPVAAAGIKPRHHFKAYGVLQRLGTKRPALGVLSKIHVFKWIIGCYDALLALTMRRRLATVLAVSAMIVLTGLVPFRRVGMQQLPKLDMRRVDVAISFDQNYPEADTDEVLADVELLLERQRERLGIRNIFVSPGGRNGNVRLYLLEAKDCPEDSEPPYTSDEVRDIIWAQLPERVPGGKLEMGVESASPSMGQLVSVRMRGDDSGLLARRAEDLKALLSTIEGVTDVKSDVDVADEEIQLVVEEAFAARAGISPYVIARTVDFALRGVRLPPLKPEGREVELWAQFQGEDRKSLADLDNLALASTQGPLVSLDRLVNKQKARSPKAIPRVNGKNVVQVSARSAERELSKVKDDIAAVTDTFSMPVGYNVEMGQELVELEVTQESFWQALALAIILIYIVMGALFESFLLPLSILTSVPLAFIGVYWMMYLCDMPMDSVALIGVILMCGVIVNNGIVIVDHINQLRIGGLDRETAILRAGHERLRPVLMTALTTILGCVPLAQGTQIGEVAFHSLGRALIGGLTTGTVLTLFIVPLFYSLVDDMRLWFLHYFANISTVRSVRQQ